MNFLMMHLMVLHFLRPLFCGCIEKINWFYFLCQIKNRNFSHFICSQLVASLVHLPRSLWRNDVFFFMAISKVFFISSSRTITQFLWMKYIKRTSLASLSRHYEMLHFLWSMQQHLHREKRNAKITQRLSIFTFVMGKLCTIVWKLLR